jgi:chromosome segregation ATPase
MNMAKDILKAYRQQKEEITKTEEKIAGLSKRKEAIEREITSLNEQLVSAESDRQKILEQFALGEVPQSEVEKTKGIVLQLKQTISEGQELVSILETKITEITQQLNVTTGLRYKARDMERLLWRSIFEELVIKIRDSVGQNLEKCFIAYQQQGPGFVNPGVFFNEVFSANLTLSLEKTQKIRAELTKEWGI